MILTLSAMRFVSVFLTIEVILNKEIYSRILVP